MNSGSVFRAASRLTSFTSVLHPQGLIPLTTLPWSTLTMLGDVRDVEPVSTDVNAVFCSAYRKAGNDETFGSQKFPVKYSREHKRFVQLIKTTDSIKLKPCDFTLCF